MRYICCGIINFVIVNIIVEDFCNFIIFNGGVQIYYLKVSLEVEWQCWVMVLELVKVKVVKMLVELDELGDEEFVL